jgi:hypothetical protein
MLFVVNLCNRIKLRPKKNLTFFLTFSLRLQLFHYGFNYSTTASTIPLRLQLFHYGFNYFTTASTISLRLQLFHYGFNYFTTASTISLRLQLFHNGFKYSYETYTGCMPHLQILLYFTIYNRRVNSYIKWHMQAEIQRFVRPRVVPKATK